MPAPIDKILLKRKNPMMCSVSTSTAAVELQTSFFHLKYPNATATNSLGSGEMHSFSSQEEIYKKFLNAAGSRVLVMLFSYSLKNQ